MEPDGTPIATATAMLATASCVRAPNVLADLGRDGAAASDRVVRDRPRVLVRDKRPYCFRIGLSRVELSWPHLGDLIRVVTNSASMILTGSPGPGTACWTARVTPNRTGTTATSAGRGTHTPCGAHRYGGS